MSATLTLAAFLELAPLCAPTVHPDTLAPVIQQESRFRLYSINTNADGRSIGSRTYATEAEAVAAATDAIARGITNLDLGPAQINWRAGHLQRRGLPLAAAFRPCPALAVAADVLTECWTRAPNRQDEAARLDETLSCYNTGGFRAGMQNGYVAGVRAQAAVIVPALRLAGQPPTAPVAAQPARTAVPGGCVTPSWDVWARCPFPTIPASPPDDDTEAPSPAPVLLRGLAMIGSHPR